MIDKGETMTVLARMKWKLRAIMADRKISIHELAEQANFSASTITRWRKVDEMPKISGPEMDRLCDALKCEDIDLIGKGKFQ
ncbi:helix-turn-helix transcriptional regulator [Acaryochloris sp. IP29b_bin.148]|uniref:helix-turn-helix domain-containing protein n=1 Tax=Acaryochloris sp. IP29b_bin.148 TaxID=2969218 RepID=UPI0026213B5E|nr:helix-turn-helix transcriptional regulator [Acaryochloris sp. IP29b_bin.148]